MSVMKRGIEKVSNEPLANGSTVKNPRQKRACFCRDQSPRYDIVGKEENLHLRSMIIGFRPPVEPTTKDGHQIDGATWLIEHSIR